MRLSALIACLAAVRGCEKIEPTAANYAALKALVEGPPTKVYEYMRRYSAGETQYYEQLDYQHSDLETAWDTFMQMKEETVIAPAVQSFEKCVQIDNRFFGVLPDGFVNLGEDAAGRQLDPAAGFDFQRPLHQLRLLLKLVAIVASLHSVNHVLCDLHPSSFVTRRGEMNPQLVTGLNIAKINYGCLSRKGGWGVLLTNVDEENAAKNPQLRKRVDSLQFGRLVLYFLLGDRFEELNTALAQDAVPDQGNKDAPKKVFELWKGLKKELPAAYKAIVDEKRTSTDTDMLGSEQRELGAQKLLSETVQAFSPTLGARPNAFNFAADLAALYFCLKPLEERLPLFGGLRKTYEEAQTTALRMDINGFSDVIFARLEKFKEPPKMHVI